MLKEKLAFIARAKEEEITRKIHLDEAKRVVDRQNTKDLTSYNKRVDYDQQIISKRKADEMRRILEFNKQQAKYKKQREEQDRTRENIYHKKMIESVSFILIH